MPDDIDYATEQYGDWLENQIENTRRRGHEAELPATGACHYCEAPVPGDAKFCGTDCQKDFQQQVFFKTGRRV